MAILTEAPVTASAFEHLIDVDLIQPWRNPRKTFDAADLQELAESIRDIGIIEPLIVRVNPESLIDRVPTEGGRQPLTYDLLAGERRLRAARLAGLKQVPCRVLDDVSDQRAAQIALVENLQRVGLNPMEEAEGYRELQELGWKQADIAKAVQRSQPSVANTMRLLKLPDDVQQLIRDRNLSPSHGVVLARYEPFPQVASWIAERAVKLGWSAHELERGLPNVWQMEEAGVVKRLSAALFDQSVCQKCPFDARRKGDYHDACLKPEHYNELQAAAQAKLKAETKAVVEAAAANGTDVPQLSSLPYGTYERFYNNRPEGCGEDCPCNAKALDRDGHLVEICTDPKRNRSLQNKAGREAGKVRRRERAEVIERLTTHVAKLTEIGERELALLAAVVLPRFFADQITPALAHLEGVDKDSLFGYNVRATLPVSLARQGSVPLVKAMVEGILREKVDSYYNGQTGAEPWSGWYLSDPVLAAELMAEPLQLDELVTMQEAEQCFLCGCLDELPPDRIYNATCVHNKCCLEGCRELGVAVVTARGGVCATCARENEICHICGCTNDYGCETEEDGVCEWQEAGLCTECYAKGNDVQAAAS